MSPDARKILETLAARDLQALAAEHGVDVRGSGTKNDHVKALAASEAVRAKLGAPSYRVRPLLAARNVPDLRALAAEHGVDVAGCEKKWDFVNRIAASPAAATILGEPGGPAAGPPPPPPPPPIPPPPPQDLDHAAADRLILQGRNQDVDFGLVDDILDQARMRFEERNYERSLELAREALLLARGTLDAFERAAWAYALLASQRLIEESGRTGRDVESAASLLRDAKVTYVSGNLAASEGLIERIQSATKALYSVEVQRLRQAMYAAEDRLAQARHVGADVSQGEEALARARDAMRRAEHGRAFDFVGETERLAADAIARRVREIEAMIPAAERSIGEARHLGADVDEASRILEKAKVAMQRGEHVLAVELLQRAERATMQSQHFQIQKAMELRLRQIDKAQKLVNYLVPIADEAAGYDLPIDDVRRYLADARDVLDQGDYVNGTVLAKQAEDVLRGFVPRLVEERAKRGITKPPAGRCGTCDSGDVAFLDDGWSRCNACGAMWRWRAPSGLWERFRSLLRE